MLKNILLVGVHNRKNLEATGLRGILETWLLRTLLLLEDLVWISLPHWGCCLPDCHLHRSFETACNVIFSPVWGLYKWWRNHQFCWGELVVCRKHRRKLNQLTCQNSEGACKSLNTKICNRSAQKEQTSFKYRSAGWRFGWEIKVCVRKWHWQLSSKTNTVPGQTWCTVHPPP